MDFNGDGLTDFWFVTAGTSQVNVRLNQENAFSSAAEWANGNPWASSSYMGFVDFNGDGLTDFWYVPSGTSQIRVRLNTGNAFSPYTVWADGNPWGGVGWFGFVDFNGDGLPDFWYATAGTSQVNVRLNQGNAFGAATEWANGNPWAGSSYMGFVDFNGDGLADFWYVPSGTSQVRVRLNTGNSFAPFIVWANENYWAGVGWFGFEDFNADGKPDLWFVNPGTSRVLVKLSTGTSFASEVEWANGNYWAGLGWIGFEDFNGDGRQDLWFVNPGTSRVLVRLSTGANFAPETEWANGNYWAGVAWKGFEDFNGDGKKELWFVNPGTSRVLVRLVSSASVDLMAGAANGLGITTSVTFKPLTDGSIYTKESGAVYPYVDIQAPLYVASSVTVSDGTGGNSVTNYTYAGAKSRHQGGGFLGFRQVTAHDPQAHIRSTTTYRQDYPYHGQPLTSQKHTDAGVLLGQNLITYTDQLIDPGKSPVWRQSLPTRTVESSYELDGSPISSVTTDTQYDSWGNPTSIVVNSGGGYSKTTTNLYDNIVDPDRWFLGRLRRSTVNSVTP